MLWCTSPLVHLDRVASAWLIKRFVDTEATFTFTSEPTPSDGVPFGFPGVELASHDAQSTTFSRIARKYGIVDPGIIALNVVVGDLVRSVMHGDASQLSPIGAAMLALFEGLLVTSTDDADCLRRSLVVYDAILDGFTARRLSTENAETSLLKPTIRMSKAAKHLRGEGIGYSQVSFLQAVALQND